MKRDLNHFVSWRRHAKSRHLPQRPPNLGERTDKSRQGLVVQHGTTNPGFMALPAFVGQERHEGEQPQQRWGCSGNGQISPLSLRFHAQIRSNLFKSDLKLPTLNEVLQDLNWAEQQIGTEQRLGGELPFGVANQHPTHGKGWEASVVPHGGLRHEFNFPVDFSVPTMDVDALPARLWIVNQGRQAWEPVALDTDSEKFVIFLVSDTLHFSTKPTTSGASTSTVPVQ